MRMLRRRPMRAITAVHITHLLEAFAKHPAFPLGSPSPCKVFWIITAPAQPLLLPRITAKHETGRDLKLLSCLKHGVSLSYSSPFGLQACESEFEDRSYAVNAFG